MTKLFALSAATMVAFAPVTALAESPLLLNSTKSTGNVEAVVGDEVVIVDEGVGGPGLLPLAIGAGAVILAAAALSGGDSSDTTGEEEIEEILE
ncbi:hypothetical protein [Jannaschia aquimarina]|uniref:Uncharacterized protein n=1 Tax=Jannaschia aquimarina TaxID=935700 RepID=A0A0D1DAN8_9RHOB|nr:hypothetical protein [Jannaschia aquimarina]KIT17003.1 hypothetical protein jaqu_11930 [Jannaschia aquimarina]SNS81256.1 hypothetical protein SAMN05421775_102396 [Jannaschia aquimarina]